MKLYALMGAFVCALATLASPAFAADVSIPWGDWVSAALNYFRQDIVAVLGLAVVLVSRKLPGNVAEMVQGMRLDSLLERAADYSIAAVDGAAKGKTIDVKIANELIAVGVQYALANGPKLVAKYADTLHAKLLARLSAKVDLAPTVSAPALGITLPSPAA